MFHWGRKAAAAFSSAKAPCRTHGSWSFCGSLYSRANKEEHGGGREKSDQRHATVPANVAWKAWRSLASVRRQPRRLLPFLLQCVFFGHALKINNPCIRLKHPLATIIPFKRSSIISAALQIRYCVVLFTICFMLWFLIFSILTLLH